jgi:nucleoside-diphosphate-sugar epimerase
MKHILLTGASGQLGKKIVNDFLTTDYAITAVSHNTEILNTLLSPDDEKKLNLLPCDLVNEKEVSRLGDIVRTVNLLIHLAGGPPAEPDNHTRCTKQVIMSTNLIGTFGDQLDHAIIGSCTSVYGSLTGARLAENHPTLPTTYHGGSQLASEKFWNIFSVNSGKTVTCLRFAPLAPVRVDSVSKPTSANDGVTIEESSQSVLIPVRTRSAGVFNIYPKIAKL